MIKWEPWEAELIDCDMPRSLDLGRKFLDKIEQIKNSDLFTPYYHEHYLSSKLLKLKDTPYLYCIEANRFCRESYYLKELDEHDYFDFLEETKIEESCHHCNRAYDEPFQIILKIDDIMNENISKDIHERIIFNLTIFV